MRWAILAALLILEASAVLLVVQFLARWLWIWIRWPVWLGLVCASLFAADAAVTKLSGQPVLSTGDWNAAKELLRLDAPYPTLRLFVLSLVGTPPVLLVLLGILSLLRWRQHGLKVIIWPIGYQSSLTTLAITFGLLLVLVFENDNAVWHKIKDMEQQSRRLAASVAPAQCADDKNAAPLFDELGGAEDVSQKKLPDPTDDLDRLRSDAWTEYFARNRGRAEELRQAATKLHCRFDIDWSNAESHAESPEVERARACLRLLYWEARRSLLDGDHDKGLANAVALRRMAELLSQDPRRLALLVATVAEHLSGDVVEHLLFGNEPTRDEVSQLMNTTFQFHERLPDYCVRQQAEHYHFFAEYYSDPAVKDSDRPWFQLLSVSSLVSVQRRLLYAADDYRALPRLFDEFHRRVSVPYGEDVPHAEEPFLTFTNRLGGATVTDLADPTVFLLGKNMAQADMKRRLVRFALEAAEQGLVEQVRSAGLDRAIPASSRPIDLFDNQPLKATIADGGLVLYSVDEDGQDDRGAERLPQSDRWDMTFCFGEAYKVRRLRSQQSTLESQ